MSGQHHHFNYIDLPIFAFPGGKRFHFVGPSGNELAVWTTLAE